MNQGLQELANRTRDDQDRAIASRQRPPVEQRMAAIHAALGRRSIARRRSPMWALGAAAAVAACVLLWWVWQPAAPLVAARKGQPVETNAWIQSAGSAETLSFSDGTQLRLAPNAALRVLQLHATGAALALEQGKVRASVVHRDEARWVVAAGPFEVHVTGTEFDASYDPVSQALQVQMFEGSVRVTGGCLDEPRRLSDRESATFSCSKGSTAAKGVEAAGAAKVAERAKPAGDAQSAEAPTSAAQSPSGQARKAASAASDPEVATAEAPNWRTLASDGRFKAALAAAEHQGFAGLCSSESAAALLTLGNTARLAGNSVRASEAYLAVRRRFAGSGAASNAAFQLGRLAFDGAGNHQAAQRWFSTYLSEAPGGGLAQEALGRVMESQHRSGQRGQAEQSAAQYLARYPKGAHANLARSLVPE